jgi:hypothetical protein
VLTQAAAALAGGGVVAGAALASVVSTAAKASAVVVTKSAGFLLGKGQPEITLKKGQHVCHGCYKYGGGKMVWGTAAHKRTCQHHKTFMKLPQNDRTKHIHGCSEKRTQGGVQRRQ